jgi:hypothetical protein
MHLRKAEPGLMEIEWYINKENSYIHLKYYGKPDYNYWAKTMEDIFSHPDYGHGMGFIADLVECDAPDTDHLKSVKDFLVAHKVQMAGTKWANVTAERTVHYGMTRMAQVFVEGLPHELNAFLTVEEALKWVTTSAKKKVT